MTVGYRKNVALGFGIGLPALGILLPLIFAHKDHKQMAMIAGGFIGLILAGPAIIVTGKVLDNAGK